MDTLVTHSLLFSEQTNNSGAVAVEYIGGQQGRPMYAPFRRPRWRLGSVVCYVALVSPVVIFFVILTVIASIEVSDRGLVTKSICGYEDESHYLFNGPQAQWTVHEGFFGFATASHKNAIC